MFDAAMAEFPSCDAAILSAAVADYRPAVQATEKIKRNSASMTLEMEANPDIAASLGQVKNAGQRLVGFALETNDERANAAGKLERKKLDMIVLNSMRDSGAGFGHDTNKVTLFFKDREPVECSLKSKNDVAADIVDNIESLL
jgi:phosphopantothenoylcysteine decarboxylase/phosphopantothenate--cysteine ligase